MRKFCTNPAKKHLHDFFRVVLFNVAKDGKLVKSGATWRQDFVSIGGEKVNENTFFKFKWFK